MEYLHPESDDGDFANPVLAHFDAPAYIRRACRVEQALADLVARCRKQRDAWLLMVRIELGSLRALAGEWDKLAPLLGDLEQLETLRALEATLKPRLRARVRPTSSIRVLSRVLRDLVCRIEHFNERWTRYLETVDLSDVNRLRDEYNRYYLLEKECAVRSPRVARQGYQPLRPLTEEELNTLLPPLPAPRLAD